jgi:hypothetical protein
VSDDAGTAGAILTLITKCYYHIYYFSYFTFHLRSISIENVFLFFHKYCALARTRSQVHKLQQSVNIQGNMRLVGKPEGKTPLGRPRSRWEDNVRIDLGGIRWGVVDWMDLAQDRDQYRDLVL